MKTLLTILIHLFVALPLSMKTNSAVAGVYEKKIGGVEYGFMINPSGVNLGVINEKNDSITIRAKDIVIETRNGKFSPCFILQPIMQTMKGTTGAPVESVKVKAKGKGLFPLVGCGGPSKNFVVLGAPTSIEIAGQFILGIATFTGTTVPDPHGKVVRTQTNNNNTDANARETTNKIGITMVNLPAGSFQMGSCKVPSEVVSRNAEENKKRAFLGQAQLTAGCDNADADASDSETPQHRVSVRSFQMGKTEVTLGQFKQFIAAAGRSDLVTDDFMKYNSYGDDAPVVQVSWNDAQDFIQWLNKTDGGGYRLPSEAEWEYACRAAGHHTYCGGDDLNALGWYGKNSGKGSRPVGGNQPNAFGLYDMSGNAWEWVQDCWYDSYRGAPSDGSAWTSGCSGDVRGLRGGSWFNLAMNARAAARNYYSPGVRSDDIGFRLARSR